MAFTDTALALVEHGFLAAESSAKEVVYITARFYLRAILLSTLWHS